MSSSFNTHLKIHASIPEQLKQWIEYELPITYRLHELTGEAHLTLLSQGWVDADWWSRWMLQVCEASFQRHIIMSTKETPCWYARSIIPRSCYQLDTIFFNRLEHESIRDLIYSESKVFLLERSVYAINDRCLEFYWVKQWHSMPEILWLRIKKYSFLERGVFFLIELFFPSLLEICE